MECDPKREVASKAVRCAEPGAGSGTKLATTKVPAVKSGSTCWNFSFEGGDWGSSDCGLLQLHPM